MPKKPGFSFSQFLLFSIILTLPLRAFAYGDPSGGYLFQIFTPLLAVLWGFWLIFAGAIRKGFRNLFRRMRVAAPNGSGSDLEDAKEGIDAGTLGEE
jgi:hypothetical protein